MKVIREWIITLEKRKRRKPVFLKEAIMILKIKRLDAINWAKENAEDILVFK